jgi:Na+/proline symporter
MFFGALLSAIKSCAAATLLAPSVTFTENILKPLLGSASDRRMLFAMRATTLAFSVIVAVYASHTDKGIFRMVENAYQVTLVAAFVPLAAGIYWKRATTRGALLSILAGLVTWIGIHAFGPQQPLVPAQLGGLLAALAGMVLGSLGSRREGLATT